MYPKKQTKIIEDFYDTDQQSIKLFRLGKLSGPELEKINQESTETLKQIIAEYGFPFRNVASEKAYLSAFLITQHSCDHGFMGKVIEIFLKANNEQIRRKDLGYLIDRLRILKNLPQLYGTQYKKNGDDVQFLPIEDEANLEKRRADLEMGSWDDYKKLIRG